MNRLPVFSSVLGSGCRRTHSATLKYDHRWIGAKNGQLYPRGGSPSPYFSQVFILKVVKVLCFDTLLQVFILKGVTGKHNIRPTSPSWSGGCEVSSFWKRESGVDSQRQGTSLYAAHDNRNRHCM